MLDEGRCEGLLPVELLGCARAGPVELEFEYISESLASRLYGTGDTDEVFEAAPSCP